MSRMVMGVVAAMALASAAHAQAPAPAPANDTAQAPSSSGSADSATATEQTYKTKDGGMYQPPAQRPASPAQDLSVYGRT